MSREPQWPVVTVQCRTVIQPIANATTAALPHTTVVRLVATTSRAAVSPRAAAAATRAAPRRQTAGTAGHRRTSRQGLRCHAGYDIARRYSKTTVAATTAR